MTRTPWTGQQGLSSCQWVLRQGTQPVLSSAGVNLAAVVSSHSGSKQAHRESEQAKGVAQPSNKGNSCPRPRYFPCACVIRV